MCQNSSNFENFDFFVLGSQLKKYQNFKEASTEVLSRAKNLSFEVSYMKITKILKKKKKVKSIRCA